MKTPAITVLMPVYNGADYLRAAVLSILDQTFKDYEFLIINDGSTDQSAKILAEFHDPRIKIIHQKNMGLAATLNKGIALAQGKYIARQDQDDLSLPSRLEKQFHYMETHPDYALLGTQADIWVNDLPTDRQHLHANDHAVLCFELLFNNPFVHSSVMFRSDVVKELGGYSTDPARQPPEDFELWSRISRSHCIANLPEVLLVYREVQNSMSRTGNNPFLDKLIHICSENFRYYIQQTRMDTHINDVCALTQTAFHSLSPKPDIQKMLRVITDAGQILAKRYQSPIIIRLAEDHIKILRHQWIQYKLKKIHLWRIAKSFHTIYKKIRIRLNQSIFGSST